MRRTQNSSQTPDAIGMVKVSIKSTLMKQSVIQCYMCEHDNALALTLILPRSRR